MTTAISSTRPAEPYAAQPTAESRRIDSVDLLRGIVMILMALDHTRDFVGNAATNPTNLATTTAALFLTRWVTHFCAPTFSLLTGVGAFLMLRRKSKREVSWFLLTRGVWLIVLEATVMRFLWQFNVDYHITFFIVLWALGWSMILLSALIFLPTSAIATIAIATIALHNMFDGMAPPATAAGRLIWFILHRPGPLYSGHGMLWFLGYPLVPWIAIMPLGFAIGTVFTWPAERRRAFLLRAGLGCVAAFLVLRFLNVYGDPFPWSVKATPGFTVLSFMNVTKTPPSLLFVLMTVGPALLFLRWADSSTPALLRPALVIGRVPFFYYVAHVLVLHVLVTIEAFVRYGSAAIVTQSPTLDRFPMTQPPGWAASLPVVYAAWAMVVVILYPMCRWYGRYKREHNYAWLSYL
jgi:uncharacterized membrane protein